MKQKRKILKAQGVKMTKKLKKLLYDFYLVNKSLDEAKKEVATDMSEYVIAEEKTEELFRILSLISKCPCGTPAYLDARARTGLREKSKKAFLSKKRYEEEKYRYDKIMKKALKMISSKKL